VQLFQRQYEIWRSFGYVVDCVLHGYVEVNISTSELGIAQIAIGVQKRGKKPTVSGLK